MTTVYRPHICPLPTADIDGTIERCDQCGKVWRAWVPGNEAYACWRLVGPLRRWWYRKTGRWD